MQHNSDDTDLPQLDAAHLPTAQPPATGPAMPGQFADIPDEAADSDLIEKEWVVKAKQIVDHTADDPYLQQAQLTRVKADYMKKRYNKDIKVPEE